MSDRYRYCSSTSTLTNDYYAEETDGDTTSEDNSGSVCSDTESVSSLEDDSTSDDDSVSSEMEYSDTPGADDDATTPVPFSSHSDRDGKHSDPLYYNSKISVLESHLLVFQYAISHGLSKRAFDELLQLIEVLLPPSKLSKSVYKLKKFFVEVFPDVRTVVYKYCGMCHKRKTNGSVGCALCPSNCSEEFVYIPIANQLKSKLEG